MTRCERGWVAARSVVVMVVGLLMCGSTVLAGPDDKPKKPDIYDRAADGEKQIAAALAEAKRDHKRVLLQFGANWCGWCHKLHELSAKDKDIAKELSYEYAVVMVDVDKVDGKPHNQAVVEKYGNPTKLGLPVLVVLDEDGKQLTTQDTGKLEEGDHHDPAKVLEFLKKWKATAPSAQEALSAGLAKAQADGKAVFVDYSAPWCGWCKRLDAYLHRPEIAAVFDSAYVTVKIDVDRMAGGKEMNEKHGGKTSGIPFFVIMDADGKVLTDSKGPKGNVGFPADPVEIAHFVKVVRQTAPKLSAAQVTVLENGLTEKALEAKGH